MRCNEVGGGLLFIVLLFLGRSAFVFVVFSGFFCCCVYLWGVVFRRGGVRRGSSLGLRRGLMGRLSLVSFREGCCVGFGWVPCFSLFGLFVYFSEVGSFLSWGCLFRSVPQWYVTGTTVPGECLAHQFAAFAYICFFCDGKHGRGVPGWDLTVSLGNSRSLQRQGRPSTARRVSRLFPPVCGCYYSYGSFDLFYDFPSIIPTTWDHSGPIHQRSLVSHLLISVVLSSCYVLSFPRQPSQLDAQSKAF